MITPEGSQLAEGLAIALAGGLVGSVLTLIGTWLHERRDRERRRRSAASALLFELRLLDLGMRDVIAEARPSNLAAGAPQPMHDALLSEFALFKPATVEAVLTAYGYGRDVRRLLDLLRQGVSVTNSDMRLHQVAKAAVAAIPAARIALLSEGALEPSGPAIPSISPTDPVLPSPFKQ